LAYPKGKPRPPTAGRRKGTPNKRTALLASANIKCNPFEVLDQIARGELECNVCKGTGKTKYQPSHGEEHYLERRCQSCYGSGKEKIGPRDRGWAAAELASYLQPKLKAIELTGGAGGPLQHAHTIKFVE
jgi:hypothetical protein